MKQRIFFSKELGLLVEQRSDLREIDWGEADGKLVKHYIEQWGNEEKRVSQQISNRKTRWDYLPIIPNSEKYNELLKRITSELEYIGKAHRGKLILVATHGRVIKTLLAEALDKEGKNIPYPQNCGIAVFRYKDGEALHFIEVRENK